VSRIDPESGGIWKDDQGPEEGGGDGIYVPPPTRESRVPELVEAAMRGIMPLTRPLKQWEPEKLNPMHIQMIMDRAMGMKNSELAQKFDLDPNRVSVILNHPYAERILGAIMATLSERVTDPIERMRGFAHEMIDTKLEIVRDPKTPKGLKNAIASDWLDRVGYGAKKQVEITTPQQPSVPAAAVSRLADALIEARKAPTTDYSRFVRNISAKEGEEGQVIPPAEADTGKDLSQTDGASPIGPQPEDEQERKSA
jgi:hypothetical protein